MVKVKEISLPKIVGKGYKRYFESKKRYLVCKGGRGSKKSKTTALKIIYLIMKYDKANALIIRKVKETLRDSCYSELMWAIGQLGATRLWRTKTSPLELTYLPTGQKILFRGLDDAMKLTSITVNTGILNLVWVEEAYEITDENAFNKLDLSIRGKMPQGYYKQIMLTLNPWSDKHWIKRRFFDVDDEDIETMTTTYLVNEFLGEEDLKLFEKMKSENPRRYQVEGLGEWGITEGLIYENYLELDFKYKQVIDENKNVVMIVGMDFGFTTDPAAIIFLLIDDIKKEIWIFDEVYKKRLTNNDIATEIKHKFFQKEIIIADTAEPKSIEELKRLGLSRIRPAIKGQGSIEYGIKKVSEYKIYIHPKCVHTLTEISSYVYDEKNGKPIDRDNHLMDALRYAVTREKKEKGIDIKRNII